MTRTLTENDQYNNPHSGPATADMESVYFYDSEGRMTSIQYPGSTGAQPGPNYSYAYDTMGRLNTMTNLATSSQLISGTTYDSANRLLTISGNVLGETRSYNTMGQLTNITSTAYGYPGGSVNTTYYYSTSHNNGKITSQTDNLSGEQVVYAYDSLNRLASASATNNSWGQSYAYDGFGNLTDQTVTAGTSTPPLHVVYMAATNRQSTDCADANGNIVGQSNPPYNCSNLPNGTQYGYDVENRLHPPTLYGVGTFYSYAPGNKRVWRGTVDNNSNVTRDEVTFWSVTGQKLATYNLSAGQAIYQNNAWVITLNANIVASNTYFGGRLLSNGVGNIATDRLGSVGKYYPWGQEKPSATTNGTEKFTGYFRDAETQLDYAVNRYHQPGVGRFLSPDPYMASGGASDPGSWNRYAYTRGDPVNRMDNLGLMDCCLKDPGPETDPCYDASSDGCDLSGGDGGDGGGGGGGGSTAPPPPCPPTMAVNGLPGGSASNQIAQNVALAIQQSANFINQAISAANADPEATNAGALYLTYMAQWLISQFSNNGPWDYKRNKGVVSQNPGNRQQVVNFGNFNFGAVMESLGLSYYEAQNAAGAYQLYLGTSNQGIPLFQWAYGDSKQDASVIQQGFNYEKAVQSGCK